MKTLYQGVRSTHPSLVKWIETDFASDEIENEFVMDMILHSLQFLEEALVLSRDESLLRQSEPDIRASLSDMDMITHWVQDIGATRNLHRSGRLSNLSSAYIRPLRRIISSLRAGSRKISPARHYWPHSPAAGW